MRAPQHPWLLWGRGRIMTKSYVLLGSLDQEENGLIFVTAMGPEDDCKRETKATGMSEATSFPYCIPLRCLSGWDDTLSVMRRYPVQSHV
jgi:hypothetical protein